MMKLITRFHPDRLDRGNFRLSVTAAIKRQDRKTQFRGDVSKEQRERAFGYDADDDGEEYFTAIWRTQPILIVKHNGTYNVFQDV